jgi:tRNA pseudouridine38-40 synthase
MSAAPHQRYKLTLAYRGTRYHGWQSQAVTENYTGPAPAAGQGIPTIQETLARAIEAVVRHPVRPVGSSRTDAGVHAKGQIAHFDTDATQIPREGLRRAVNAALPTDITVKALDAVDDTYDAIGSTTSKRYQYAIWNQPDRPTFFPDLAWHRWQRLDRAAMRQAAQQLIGTHDFASFARPGHGRDNTVRTVLSCDVSARGPLVVVGVEGTGFLWNMVRIIVGTMVEVGLGRLGPEQIETILAARDRQAAGPTAPPHGLYLQWIRTRERAVRDENAATASASPSIPSPPDVTLRTHHGQYARQIVGIAQELGEWFTPQGLAELTIDAPLQSGFIAAARGQPVGFILFNVTQGVARITWMAVARAQHRCGIGRRMIDRLLAHLRTVGVTEIHVETPGPSVDCEPYARTRAFYAAMGFTEHRRTPQPDNPQCPELLVLRRQV